VADYRIGTSGYNYEHWKKRFYPDGLPKRCWFGYYARRFPTVELNYSFYREPSAETYDRWRDQAPPNFRYALKAHRYLTHRKRLNDYQDSLKRVITGARRLKPCLGPVLYQLPPNFKRTDQMVERLGAFLADLPGDIQHAVEFREKSWWENDATFELLKKHRVAFCAHDMGGVTMPYVATAGHAYVRFHGGGEKYRGDYPARALRDFAKKIDAMAAKQVWIYFNNDIDGHAIHNARTLARELGVALPEPGPD
jgi:uncharacterized protein YecE (DUF72 family)